MRGLSMLYLSLISDQLGSEFGGAHCSLNYGVVSMAYIFSTIIVVFRSVTKHCLRC